jgi:hypothetical protein
MPTTAIIQFNRPEAAKKIKAAPRKIKTIIRTCRATIADGVFLNQRMAKKAAMMSKITQIRTKTPPLQALNLIIQERARNNSDNSLVFLSVFYVVATVA